VAWPFFRVAVAEQSMLPVLYPGDWLLCRRTRHIRPGDLVIAQNPEKPDMLLVKRATRQAGSQAWWLESENPYAGAIDSNRFGPVPGQLIAGRVLTRYWPVRRPR
jgi:SOS-response transcriptional repressor LexA